MTTITLLPSDLNRFIRAVAGMGHIAEAAIALCNDSDNPEVAALVEEKRGEVNAVCKELFCFHLPSGGGQKLINLLR